MTILGVGKSSAGRRWVSREGDVRLGLALAQRFGLPEVVGRIMAARGIDVDSAATWLDPTLAALLPDPSHLRDMDVAAGRIAAAVRDGETVAILGDYDVDGATSTALLQRFLAAAGGRVINYIPDRVREGYGPNTPALLSLKEKNASIVITVDCGITAFEPLDAAAGAGLEVIVIDHHVAEPRLPRALAVVNPNRLDDDSAHGQLAAVGVTFLLAIAINRVLRDAGWYTGRRAEPDLRNMLDLVALGTVCDVVPLTGINRALVAQGLKVMARRGNAGLAALADVAGLNEAPEAWHAGFLLGPRVNAGGRVGESGLGVALLTAPDQATALPIARQLDIHNRERREIEAACLEQAIAQVEANPMDDGLVYASAEGWHPGVIGIVAGRLRERYNRPACVVALAGGIGRGSGRSMAGVDLGAAIIAARQSDLLINGGGHAMAAGFTIAGDGQSAFRDFLAERIAGQTGPGGPKAELGIDGALQPGAATIELVGALARLAPFGAGNREPRFAIPAARIVKADVVGENHVRCIVTGEDGGRLKAIAFRCVGQPLGSALLNSRGAALHLAGHLRIDRWQGRESVQLIIEDAAGIV
jgi:single-stranded-DNA-specific exonuclease